MKLTNTFALHSGRHAQDLKTSVLFPSVPFQFRPCSPKVSHVQLQIVLVDARRPS